MTDANQDALAEARRERDEAIQHIRDLAARVDGDGGQRQDADGSRAETVRRVDAAIVQLQRERSAAEHRQVMSRLDELCAEIQLSGESRAAALEAARADRAERERDEAIARADRATARLKALEWQVEIGGCAASRLGETTYECDATRPCGLCRLRARAEKEREAHG